MRNAGLDPFIDYYQRELNDLRREGARFAKHHPRIAARLDLGPDPSRDPHTERLLESFAFMMARLRRDMDNHLPDFSADLMTVLYPQFVRPIPSVAIAEFAADPKMMSQDKGYVVPRGTSLMMPSAHGTDYPFRTCYPLTLWPITVVGAGIVHRDTLGDLPMGKARSFVQIRLLSQNVSLNKLNLTSLAFYLHGPRPTVKRLYDGIMGTNDDDVCLIRTDDRPQMMRPLRHGRLHPMGFKKDHHVLPWPPSSHPAYHILLEYMVIPEKFSFIELTGIDVGHAIEQCDIFIPLDARDTFDDIVLDRHSFKLGCTPIINLFDAVSEPILLDHKNVDYLLNAGLSHGHDVMIYSVDNVYGSSPQESSPRLIPPYFSTRYDHDLSGESMRWTQSRRSSGDADHPMTLRFVSVDQHQPLAPIQTVYAQVTCCYGHINVTNKAQRLMSETAFPVTSITCLIPPTRPLIPTDHTQPVWTCISHLGMNYYGLRDDPTIIKGLAHLYAQAFGLPNKDGFDSIAHIYAFPQTMRVAHGGRSGLAQGMGIDIILNDETLHHHSGILMGYILSQFFSMSVDFHRFTDVKLYKKTRSNLWKTYPPMAGYHPIL